jgi:hypothetical protein
MVTSNAIYLTDGSGDMRRATIVLLLTAGTALGCAQQMSTRDMLVEQQALEGRLAAWVTAQNNAKIDSVMLYYDSVPELKVIWPGGQSAEGWDEVHKFITDFYGGIQYENFVLTQKSTEVLDEHAAVTVFRHSTDVVQRGGNRLPLTAGNGVLVWVKDPHDRTWKIHSELRAVNYQPPTTSRVRR